ncbi:MAG: hypothetical protein JJU45_17730 [Acidimicrobiia bacterium]|nr:hypothetical protein [Acidimicrobiia bacterium]
MSDPRSTPLVSAADRAAMRRQVAALAEAEESDELTGADLEQAISGIDERRLAAGRPPLDTRWFDRPEAELHERARALGLLD